VDDGGDDTFEELSEPISALGMTGLLMEPIYPNSPNAPPIPSLPGNEEEQVAGAMEVIGEEEEEERPGATETASERVSEVAPDLEADRALLDPSRMVGLTIVSRSRRISIDNLDHTPLDSPSSYSPILERAPGNPLFPGNFSTLSIGPTLPARHTTRHSLPNSLIIEQGRIRIGGPRSLRAPGNEYAVSTASEGSDH